MSVGITTPHHCLHQLLGPGALPIIAAPRTPARMAVMEKRRSIDVPGAKHVNPIPSASRRGPFVVSGAISGADPQTGKVPADLDEQCRLMFENVRRIMSAAGGSPDDIVKMTVWITDRSLREIMNRHWVAMFPDPQSRPARHTLTSRDFAAPMPIQCDLMAVL